MRGDTIQEWFDLALQQSEDSRQDWVNTHCPPAHRELLLSLLQQADSEGPLLPAGSRPVARPKIIGPYTLLEELGAGGMGIVHRAQRSDGEFDGYVAIKLLDPFSSEEAKRRFQTEKNVLAKVNHPHIAYLKDAGQDPETERPYVVMEFVEGKSIVEHCRVAGLSVRDRVRLVIQVCEALQHLHSRQIVHRDIKPSNVMVSTGGESKLLDFGIAKLLSRDVPDAVITDMGRGPLTWQYASPEQVLNGEITIQTDVHGLGLLLYEILCEAPAFQFTTPELRGHVVVNTIPVDPSVIAKQRGLPEVAKDLDQIVGKALQKEPQKRYSTIVEMKDDLQRWLEYRPIAGQRSPRDRAWKFVKRNPLLTAAAVVAICLGLVALRNYFEVRRAQEETQERFDQVRQLARITLFETDRKIQNLPGSTPTRVYLVAEATKYLDQLNAASAAAPPSLLVEIAEGYMRLGDIQGNYFMNNLSDPMGALKSYGQALQLLQRIPSRDCPQCQELIGNLQIRIGDVKFSTGKQADAGTAYQTAMQIGNNEKLPLLRVSAHGRFMNLHMGRGSAGKAIEEGEKGLATLASFSGPAPRPSNADCVLRSNLGNAYRATGQPEKALVTLNDAVRLLNLVKSNGDGDLATDRYLAATLSYRGMVEAALQKRNEAETDFKLAIALMTPRVDIDPMNAAYHKILALAYKQMTQLMRSQQRPEATQYQKLAEEQFGFLASRPKATINDVNDYLDILLDRREKLDLDQIRIYRDKLKLLMKDPVAIYLQTLGAASCVLGEKREGRAALDQAYGLISPAEQKSLLALEIKEALEGVCR